MGSFSIWHWLIVLVIVLVLFGGRGKISQIMGDFGKGLKSFKKGVKDDEEETAPTAGAAAGRVTDEPRATVTSPSGAPAGEPHRKPDQA
jgi:sec-independent protein translocase protein TatA